MQGSCRRLQLRDCLIYMMMMMQATAAQAAMQVRLLVDSDRDTQLAQDNSVLAQQQSLTAEQVLTLQRLS